MKRKALRHEKVHKNNLVLHQTCGRREQVRRLPTPQLLWGDVPTIDVLYEDETYMWLQPNPEGGATFVVHRL